MKHTSIIIEGYYGCGSLGDEAILQGLLQMIKKQYSSVDITVVSFNPKQTSEMHDVKAVGKGFGVTCRRHFLFLSLTATYLEAATYFMTSLSILCPCF